MKTPTELKKEHQLSDEEITKQVNKSSKLLKIIKMKHTFVSLKNHLLVISFLSLHINTTTQHLWGIISSNNVFAS